MTTPNDQVKALQGAIRRQQDAREAARAAARDIDRERQQPTTSDGDQETEQP